VLSVYLDLDPSRFPTPAACDTQLGALFDQARREGARDDVDRAAALLYSEPTITRGARALAIFCSVAADILEVVRLPRPVEPMVVVDRLDLERLGCHRDSSSAPWVVAMLRGDDDPVGGVHNRFVLLIPAHAIVLVSGAAE
jgi:hypothetical protein